MEVLVFNDKDLKKDGTLKKRNNARLYPKEDFKKFVKDFNLTMSKGYIDVVGFLSNGEKFRCYYNGLIVGVTSLIEEVE